MLTLREQVARGCDAFGVQHTLEDGHLSSFNDQARPFLRLLRQPKGLRELRWLQHDLTRQDPTIGAVVVKKPEPTVKQFPVGNKNLDEKLSKLLAKYGRKDKN